MNALDQRNRVDQGRDAMNGDPQRARQQKRGGRRSQNRGPHASFIELAPPVLSS